MTYNFYVVDTSGSHSAPVISDCSSDITAMMHAGSLIGPGCSVEVWRGDRFVGELGQFFSRWASARTSGASPGTRGHSLT